MKGLWEEIFRDLTSVVGTHYEHNIDSAIVKAHRTASAKKGEAAKPLARAGVTHDENPCGHRPTWPSDSLSVHAEQYL